MKTICALQYGTDAEMTMQVYLAIIRPKIDYGKGLLCMKKKLIMKKFIIVYGTANGSLLESIDVVANATMQIATGTFKPLKVPVAICIASSLPLCKC